MRSVVRLVEEPLKRISLPTSPPSSFATTSNTYNFSSLPTQLPGLEERCKGTGACNLHQCDQTRRGEDTGESVFYAIGISAEHSLALASRSLTVALAIPATENLGGDLSTVAAVAVMSGIIGALIGQRLLNWMRIPKEYYVTRGITLGANSAAIITALLLQTDPRAAAMSSLSMSLFGTITVILSSVPPIASTIRSLVS
ncbi:hypothetical protein BHE90_009505 [Fusarium euwallaceae]|uniref:Uncharacterized protein n=1 Tax=Fusarium euwallaceae TaxID=1147111 RepID=A0A430LK21_9HYPO|nr:hypothetical protein BHE90_009505 [Fusarium euwallaceae]